MKTLSCLPGKRRHNFYLTIFVELVPLVISNEETSPDEVVEREPEVDVVEDTPEVDDDAFCVVVSLFVVEVVPRLLELHPITDKESAAEMQSREMVRIIFLLMCIILLNRLPGFAVFDCLSDKAG